jgi:2-dehydro-3-deoxyphosphogalactonate aldolase
MSVTWASVLRDLPLIAILRGVTPKETLSIGETLCDAGFLCLEVPLNSPDALTSIRLLREHMGDRALVGAGTVLSPKAVEEVEAAGGQIVISPNTDPAVIARTKQLGLVSLPAFLTASEAFCALDAGADAIKLFPAESGTPSVLKALKAVRPPETAVVPVGGIEPTSMCGYLEAGASGFGLGSALYRKGASAAAVRDAAELFVREWRRLRPPAATSVDG